MIKVKINRQNLNESLLLETPYIVLDGNDEEVLQKFYDLLEMEMSPKYEKAFLDIKDSNAFDLAAERFKLLNVYNQRMPKNISKFYIDLKDFGNQIVTFLIDDSNQTTIQIVDEKDPSIDTLPNQWYLSHVLAHNKELIDSQDLNSPIKN